MDVLIIGAGVGGLIRPDELKAITDRYKQGAAYDPRTLEEKNA